MGIWGYGDMLVPRRVLLFRSQCFYWKLIHHRYFFSWKVMLLDTIFQEKNLSELGDSISEVVEAGNRASHVEIFRG